MGPPLKPTPPLSAACRSCVSSPTVKIFHSSCNPNGDPSTIIQLLCFIRGIPADHINVTWLVNDQESSDLSTYVGPLQKEGKLWHTHSELNITQDQWVAEITYTCRADFNGLIVVDQARKCTGKATGSFGCLPSYPILALSTPRVLCGSYLPNPLHPQIPSEALYAPSCPSPSLSIPRPPSRTHCAPLPPEPEPRGVRIFLIPPSPMELYVHKDPKLTCLVVDLAGVESMTLNWFWENGTMASNALTTTKKHYNGTFSVISKLPVLTEDWMEGEVIRCELEHKDLPRKMVHSIRKKPGEQCLRVKQGRAGVGSGLTLLPAQESEYPLRFTCSCHRTRTWPPPIR